MSSSSSSSSTTGNAAAAAQSHPTNSDVELHPINCINCRKNHRQCSRTKPSCEHCTKRGVECVYVEPKRKGRPLKQRQKVDAIRWVNESDESSTTSRVKRPHTDTDISTLENTGNSISSGGASRSTDTIHRHTNPLSSSPPSSSPSPLSLASLFQFTDSEHSLPPLQSHIPGSTARVSIPKPSQQELEQHKLDLQFFLVNVILDESTLTITKDELWQHLHDSQNDQVRDSTAFRIREVYMIAARLHVLQRLGVNVAKHRPHYRLAIAILQDPQLIVNITVSNAKNLAAALFMLVSYLMTCPSDMRQFNSQLITIAKYWAHASLEMYRAQYGEPKMQDSLYECIMRILHVSIPHCDVSSHLLDPVFCTSTKLVEKLQILSTLIPVIPHGDRVVATLRDIPEVNVERCTQVLDSVVSEIRVHPALPIVAIVSQIVFYGLKLDYLLQIETCIQISKHLQDRMHVEKELKIMREQIDTTTDTITQLYANNISLLSSMGSSLIVRPILAAAQVHVQRKCSLEDVKNYRELLDILAADSIAIDTLRTRFPIMHELSPGLQQEIQAKINTANILLQFSSKEYSAYSP